MLRVDNRSTLTDNGKLSGKMGRPEPAGVHSTRPSRLRWLRAPYFGSVWVTFLVYGLEM